jgi:hypothetical protein
VNKIPKNEKGFSVVEVVLMVVVMALIGTAGWLVYKNHHKTTMPMANTSTNILTTTTKTSISTTTTSKPAQQTDPTAGWATYTSTLGGFSFKYPITGWTFDGFQGNTPVSGSQMNGSETQVRLFETSRTYSIIINVGAVNQVDLESDSYSQGTVSTLSNSLQAWLTSASAVSNPQCFSGSPIDLDLVSNGNFYYTLSNGQHMSYFASFCYGQKDTTNLNYQQQVAAPELTVAKDVLSSFTFK